MTYIMETLGTPRLLLHHSVTSSSYSGIYTSKMLVCGVLLLLRSKESVVLQILCTTPHSAINNALV